MTELLKGDSSKQQAFLKLYEPIHENFVRFCQARVGDTELAKDLINDTILIAFEKFESIRNYNAFLYFLFGIARRLLSNSRRRNKFWGEYDETTAERYESAVESPDSHTDASFLYQALDKLPEEQKEALILFEISGFSLKEIQEIQQGSLSAVKARIARGRRKLADLLRDKETEIFVKAG